MSALKYLPQAGFNGRIGAIVDLRVSVLGDGFMFGHGLFETIKVVGGKPLLFEDHLARLGRSAVALGLAPASDQLRSVCDQVIAANSLSEGNLKLIVFQNEAGTGEIVLARAGLYPAELYQRGYRLRIEGAGARGRLAAHKTLNYLENISAKRRAMAAGFDEPVLVDASGSVLEGATTNVFIVRDGRVRTPPLDGRILPGVMRAQVLRFLGARGCEEPVSRQGLAAAGEVFVTNALLGVMPVSQIDEYCYDLAKNAVTRELMARLTVCHGSRPFCLTPRI